MTDSGTATQDELSELGRRLSAARRTVEGVCPVCGRTFSGPANKKYDRHSCAVIASRRKRRDETVKEGNC